MLRGLAAGGEGMMARMAMQDTIANNLANVSTSGFQREIASLTSTGSQDPQAGSAILTPVTSVDSRQGALQQTGNSADIALDGPGYLVVQTPTGQKLSRGTALHTNAAGELATGSGYPVLGSDGRTLNVAGQTWQITADGTVTSAGKSLGRLRIVEPAGSAQHEGGALISAPSVRDVGPGAVKVAQGYVEHSNVEPVHEMVDMIGGMRAFEANEKSVQSADQTLQDLFQILH